jgi:hydrogenase expression/formation protein HypC
MCLAVPGRVQEIYESHGLRTGRMDFGGVVKEVCLAYVPEVEVGDYAIVHVGFAISKIDEDSALETLRLLEETGILKEELGGENMTPRDVDGAPASRFGDATSPSLGSP